MEQEEGGVPGQVEKHVDAVQRQRHALLLKAAVRPHQPGRHSAQNVQRRPHRPCNAVLLLRLVMFEQ